MLALLSGLACVAGVSQVDPELWIVFTVFVAAPLACNLVIAIIVWLFLRGGMVGGVVASLLTVACVGGLILLFSGQLRL